MEYEVFSKKSYNPYCPYCSSCGETGCCSPTVCINHPKGHYCQTNRDEVDIYYYTLKEFWNQLEDPMIEKKLEEIYYKHLEEFAEYRKKQKTENKKTFYQKILSFFNIKNKS